MMVSVDMGKGVFVGLGHIARHDCFITNGLELLGYAGVTELSC